MPRPPKNKNPNKPRMTPRRLTCYCGYYNNLKGRARKRLHKAAKKREKASIAAMNALPPPPPPVKIPPPPPPTMSPQLSKRKQKKAARKLLPPGERREKPTCSQKRQSLENSNAKRQSVTSPFHKVYMPDMSSPTNSSKCTCIEPQHPKARPIPVKRDMATSPHLAPKSPTIKVCTDDLTQHVIYEARPVPCQVPCVKSPGPRAMKANTPSPRLEAKVTKGSPVKENPNRVLEKSNSLGETKPPRMLRNTRSLSPRPPVKHQHAITVSDENDVVSVKLSPNDEFVEENATKLATPSPKKSCRSERTSPNILDGGRLLYEDRFANNRSTGCLVYVPSDPWLRISDEEDAGNTLGKQKKKKKDTKRVEKSFSRPNIASLDNEDPWVWKGPGDAAARKNAYRQSKSLQSTAAEFSSLKLLPAKKDVTARPRLQRSKSPILLNDPEDLAPVQKGATLSVGGVNHLLPRHSFSTSPTQRDEELQLNIRRLSEQMRHTPAYNTAYEAMEKQETRRAASPLPPPPPPPPADPLLETTC